MGGHYHIEIENQLIADTLDDYIIVTDYKDSTEYNDLLYRFARCQTAAELSLLRFDINTLIDKYESMIDKGHDYE